MSSGKFGIVQVLKRSFGLLVREPGFIGLYLLPFTVLAIAYTHMGLILGTLNPVTIISSILGLILWTVLYAVAYVILDLVALAAIILKVAALERRKNISFGKALSEGIAYVPRLFVAEVLFLLIIVGPLLVLMLFGGIFAIVGAILSLLWLIPMLYISIRLCLFSYACVIKDLGPVECLEESWRVTREDCWPIFITALILGIISVVIGLIPVIGSLIATLVFGPARIIAFTLIYLGVRTKLV